MLFSGIPNGSRVTSLNTIANLLNQSAVVVVVTKSILADSSFLFGGVPPGSYDGKISVPWFLDPELANFAVPTADLAITGVPVIRPGDVNRSGSINASDFAIMAGVFGDSVTFHPVLTDFRVDLNVYGFVNTVDFAIAAGGFGLNSPHPRHDLFRAKVGSRLMPLLGVPPHACQ